MSYEKRRTALQAATAQHTDLLIAANTGLLDSLLCLTRIAERNLERLGHRAGIRATIRSEISCWCLSHYYVSDWTSDVSTIRDRPVRRHFGSR